MTPEFSLSLPADLPGEWVTFGDHASELGKGAGWTWRIDDFSIQLAPRPAKSEWVLYASAPDFRCDHEGEPLSIRINVSGESVRAVLGAMWDRTIEDTKHGNDWSAFRLAFDGLREWCWNQSKAVPVEAAPVSPAVKANSAPTFRGVQLDYWTESEGRTPDKWKGRVGNWAVSVRLHGDTTRETHHARGEFTLTPRKSYRVDGYGPTIQSALDDMEANIQKLKEAL